MSPSTSCLPESAPDASKASRRTPSLRRRARAVLVLACAALGAVSVWSPRVALAQGRKAPAAEKPRAEPPAASRADAQSPSEPQRDLVETCLEDHARGQELRLGGKLRDARDAFLHCAATHCPNQIQRDCSSYLEQIQVQVPSIVLRVTADGVNRGDVKVFVDGQLVLDKLTGKAIDLDPGSHQLRVVLPHYPANEQSLIVSEGERFRVVEVNFARPQAATPAAEPRSQRKLETHRPIPASSYIFGTVGAAALVSGVGWGLSTWTLKQQLEASNCAPECPQKSVDILRQRALFADVSWGVGAASLIAATVFYLIRPEVPVETEGRVEVGVAFKKGGALGTISVSGF